MRSALRTSSRILISPLPSMFAGRDSSVTTWSCWSWSSAASSIVTMRSSPGMNALIALSVVVLPVPVPPEIRMFSLPLTHAAMNWAERAVSVPKEIRSLMPYGSRENFRIVTVGPLSASGGMIALTRLPSGRRASTIGDASSTRRPTCETILSMMRITCESSTKLTVGALELAVALDVDLVGRVDHDLGHAVVAQQRLDRAVAEDVVRQLPDDLAALFARQRRAVERELLVDRAVDAVGEVVAVLLVELGAELGDALVMDACLQLRIRVDRDDGRRRRAVAVRR